MKEIYLSNWFNWDNNKPVPKVGDFVHCGMWCGNCLAICTSPTKTEILLQVKGISKDFFTKENKSEKIQRLQKNGYTVIHLFKNWYLIRNYSKNFKKFSFYSLMRG